MIKMGYGYLATFEPAGVDLTIAIASLIYTMASVAIAYLFTNKFGYSQYLALVATAIGFVFYIITGYPDTAVLLVLGLFGVAKLIGKGAFTINPTLIGSGSGSGSGGGSGGGA